MTRLIGRTDLVDIWCCCKTKLEVLSSEEKATTDISESDMHEIRNKLQKLFPTGELQEYDVDVFVNKDDILSYIQSNKRDQEIGKVFDVNMEKNGNNIKTDQDLNIISAISQRGMMTQSVERMQENIDEIHILASKLYDILPGEDSKNILSRILQLSKESGANIQKEKQKKETNNFSTEAVIHYETEKKLSKGLTSKSNYLHATFILISLREIRIMKRKVGTY